MSTPHLQRGLVGHAGEGGDEELGGAHVCSPPVEFSTSCSRMQEEKKEVTVIFLIGSSWLPRFDIAGRSYCLRQRVARPRLRSSALPYHRRNSCARSRETSTRLDGLADALQAGNTRGSVLEYKRTDDVERYRSLGGRGSDFGTVGERSRDVFAFMLNQWSSAHW